MRFELQYQPSATIAICHLDPQDTLVSEGGAMMAIKGPVSVNTTTHQKGSGGILAGVKRLFSGESFFMNQYKSSQPSQVWLCAALPGDMVVKKLNGENLVVAGGAFVACDHNVQIKLEWQGLKSALSGESLFWIKAHGKGDLLLNSFGFIYPVQVDGEYIVDTGHIVAFEETLQFSISKASTSWLQAFMSGEGFVCRFKGKGTVWCQSHNPKSYGQELTPYLKARKN